MLSYLLLSYVIKFLFLFATFEIKKLKVFFYATIIYMTNKKRKSSIDSLSKAFSILPKYKKVVNRHILPYALLIEIYQRCC